MLLQCRSLFMGEVKSLPIDTELDFSQVEYQGICPIPEPVHVVGEITVRAGVVQLTARATFITSMLTQPLLQLQVLSVQKALFQ